MGRIPYDFSDSTLILMMGLPYSGKSTKAAALSSALSAPIVCPDAIRVAMHGYRYSPPAEPAVWFVARMMVRALFLGGHQLVILDATNNTRKRRDDWRGSEGWSTTIVHEQAELELCLERARAADDEDIIPVIERMAEEHQPPDEDEPVADAEAMLELWASR